MKKIGKKLFWVPRILSILFVFFIFIFSFDVFGNGLTFWQTLFAFLMHNIPTFILLAVVIISWKHELVGAIAFALAGVLYCILTLVMNPFEWYLLSWAIQIAGPAFLIGILFLINWRRKNN